MSEEHGEVRRRGRPGLYTPEEARERKRARAAEYNERPEVKAKKREYFQRPEVKAKQREYNERPEVKAKKREYNERPEVKAKKREYNERPEVKAKKRESALARWRSRAEADPAWKAQELQRLYNWLATRCIGTVPINAEAERYLADRAAVDPEQATIEAIERDSALDTIAALMSDGDYDILLTLATNDMNVEITAEELGLAPSAVILVLSTARSLASGAYQGVSA